AARRAGVRRVAYASTIWVYGDGCDGIVDEDARLGLPSHLYTATKLAGEMYCRSYERLYGLEYTILRFGIPYGPRARPAAVGRAGGGGARMVREHVVPRRRPSLRGMALRSERSPARAGPAPARGSGRHGHARGDERGCDRRRAQRISARRARGRRQRARAG